MEKKTNYIVSDEEILYLTMHINRIKLRSNNI
ncbi:PRD domain-containing protein [Lachnobacterium bovis]|nr:PRD domain-containing protein [Lachnobacterium bovis]